MKRGKGEVRKFGAKDLGVIGMAIRKRFPMSKELRAAVVATMADNLTNDDPNVQMSAVRAAVAMERTNIAGERKQGGTHQHLHLHGGMTCPIEDADYVEFAVDRLATDQVQPGVDGVSRDPREVEAIPARSVHEQVVRGSGGGTTAGEQ